MINRFKNYHQLLFHWSLAMSGMALAFPSYSLISISVIILAVITLFTKNFQEKKLRLKQNFKWFWWISLPFWLNFIGLFYSGNFSSGLAELQRKLPLLVIPLVLAVMPITRQSFFFVWKYTSLAVIAGSLAGLIKAIYLYDKGMGNYFFYDKFARILVRHTTYYAMLTSIAILYFIYQWIETKKKSYILAILYLLSILYILSSRMPVLALAIATGYLIYRRNYRFRFPIIIGLTAGLVLLFATPYFQKRFKPKTWQATSENQITQRIKLWKISGKNIIQTHPLTGLGTGTPRNELFERYKQAKLYSAYKNHYNAHNQWMEFLLNNGLTGLILFSIGTLIIILHIFRHHPIIDQTLVIVILFPMLTESILERLTGIVIYALFIGLILFQTGKKNKTKKKLAVFGPYPPPLGGMSMHIKRMQYFLDKENIPYTIFNHYASSGTNVIPTRKNPFWYIKFLFQNTYPVIHFHQFFLWHFFYYYVYSKINSSHQIIVTIHSDRLRLAPAKLQKILFYFIKNTSRLHLISVSKKLHYLLKENRIENTFIPAYVPPVETKVIKLPPCKRTRFLFSIWKINASLSENVYNVPLIFQFLQKHRKQFKMIFMIGSRQKSDLKYLNKLIKEYHLENDIKLVFDQDLVSMLPNVSFLVRTNLHDGSPLSLQEALDLGIPAIASDAGTRPPGTVLFKSNNLTDLEEKIFYVLNTPKEILFKNYKKPDFHIRLLNLYKKLLFD